MTMMEAKLKLANALYARMKSELGTSKLNTAQYTSMLNSVSKQLVVEIDCSHICNYHSKGKGNNNMIKPIIRYFAKKYVASIITDMLKQTAQKIDLETWKTKIKNVLQFCQFLLEKLDDNAITNDEIVEIAEKAKNLVK